MVGGSMCLSNDNKGVYPTRMDFRLVFLWILVFRENKLKMNATRRTCDEE